MHFDPRCFLLPRRSAVARQCDSVMRVTINKLYFRKRQITLRWACSETADVSVRANQYLAYDSHHPQSVKRGIVKCLYERAKRLVTKPSVISEEKKHLSSVLVSNGYPFSFLQKLTKTGRPNDSAKPAIEFKATAVLPYVKGVSEQLRRSLQNKAYALFSSRRLR